MSDSIAIGIDLGTTNSCVAVYRNGSAEVIPSDHGNRTTPSWVTYIGSKRLVGEKAKQQALRFPSCSIFEVKRLIGRDTGHPAVQKDIERWPFTVIQGENRKPIIQIKTKNQIRKFTPEQISAEILKHLKRSAEKYLGRPVTDAVITVPANFNDKQRQLTKDAAAHAGLNVLRLVNEPTAAAIAYGLKGNQDKRNVCVYDLGAGTFDVTILSIQGDSVEVLATQGDTHLGGKDFDERLMEFAIEKAKTLLNYGIPTDKFASNELRAACEQAKITLSSMEYAVIEIPSPNEEVKKFVPVTRCDFEEVCDTHFLETIAILTRALSASGLTRRQINDVVLVGGSTRIPMIQALVREYFVGKEPNKNINPDEAVAIGAALEAARLCGQPTLCKILWDVVPLSLGIETHDEFMEILIPRSSKIPLIKTQRFSTTEPKQSVMRFKVLQGEREFSKDNLLIGTLDIEVTRVSNKPVFADVTFKVNENGILEVKVLEVESNQIKSISFYKVYQELSDESIKEMIENAKQFDQYDKKEKKRRKSQMDLGLSTYLYRSGFKNRSISCDYSIRELEGEDEEMEEEKEERKMDDVKNMDSMDKDKSAMKAVEDIENLQLEDEELNRTKAACIQNLDDITQVEHPEFYKKLFNDWGDSLYNTSLPPSAFEPSLNERSENSSQYDTASMLLLDSHDEAAVKFETGTEAAKMAGFKGEKSDDDRSLK